MPAVPTPWTLDSSAVTLDSSIFTLDGGQTYLTVGQAMLQISAAGLITGLISYAYSSSVPANYVISQTPAGGTLVNLNVPVNLLVSMGPAGAAVTTSIPNVVGMNLWNAQLALLAASCDLGVIGWVQDNTGVSVVEAQSPGAGGPVAVGTQVNLTVCSGPVQTYPTSATVPSV